MLLLMGGPMAPSSPSAPERAATEMPGERDRREHERGGPQNDQSDDQHRMLIVDRTILSRRAAVPPVWQKRCVARQSPRERA